jgi:hypothetical protein
VQVAGFAIAQMQSRKNADGLDAALDGAGIVPPGNLFLCLPGKHFISRRESVQGCRYHYVVMHCITILKQRGGVIECWADKRILKVHHAKAWAIWIA